MRKFAHCFIAILAVCGLAFTQAKPKESYILKGSPMGGVKFTHALHQDRAAKKCETCHHASKPEHPNKTAQQLCTDCHTKPVMAGMKTGVPAAFHNPTAKAGVCIDCHLKENTAGKKAPVKCVDCHKKENV